MTAAQPKGCYVLFLNGVQCDHFMAFKTLQLLGG
jgi:hypothetical protein